MMGVVMSWDATTCDKSSAVIPVNSGLTDQRLWLYTNNHEGISLYSNEMMRLSTVLKQQLEHGMQTKRYNIGPHEAVPEVSKGKVHITQNKHVPIEIHCDFLNTFPSTSHATLS